MVQYSDQDGVPGDRWGEYMSDHIYYEQNATAQDYHNITIYEPCNYASNVAYYHTSTQICDRINLGSWTSPMESVKVCA